MTEWCKTFDDLTDQERRELEGDASHLAIRFARLAAYAARRRELQASKALDGSEQHDAAVRTQNTVAASVRKALGFSYPEDKIRF
jgi:hypothetical protein